ncbi:MAG: family 78 glycoside hydrolase catalytic domain [Devosia sp.]|uniref:alpha-L-rhamnosidase n=1 Tax=Devosia sp. TaxID=1871048 RepID=UPI0024C85FED|nr:alpha-L-rhamnosidase [Devosia sp.]UYN98081.1 MAG: family 78 glycoside hydrolase catalytic domain [Devosia sp.]
MSPLVPYDLRCEHLATPRGLNTSAPRFSWALRGTGVERRQTAYRLCVTQSSGAPLWDSGKVTSPRTQMIDYAGPVLPKDAILSWTVTVWDENDTVSAAAEPATIFTGLAAGDWQAQWIARYFVLPAGREVPADNPYDNRWQARPADYLRRDFSARAEPVRALLYVTALGLYEAYLNGQRIGQDVMAPGWTDYHRRVDYQVHEVTDLVRSGGNVLGAIIGEGWYCGRVGHNQRRAGNHYGGRPAFLCQLHLTHADGSLEIITTDEHWQTRQGPICYSDFLMGEMVDARLDITGWDTAPGPLPGWQPVEVFVPDPAAPQLDAARMQPAREVARLPATFSHRTANGAAIFDLGQNIAGYVELSVSAKAGDRFTLRHAEMLDAAGEAYTANLRHAVATDIFVTRGGGRETFKPRFTFHGFRFVEVTLPEAMSPDDIGLVGIAIQSDTPLCGEIETGHAQTNQLLSNIFWSQRDNFLSVPTDCPQRDERYGWTADAQVFWKTAGYTMDVSAFLSKWMLDIEDGQSPDGAFPDVAPTKPLNPYRLTPQPGAPGWGDAPVIMAWEHWLRYADKGLLERYWPALEAWAAHIERANPDRLRRQAVYNNYGDWLSVGPASDRTLVATAYWVRVADLMVNIAGVLGHAGRAAHYTALGQTVRQAFAKAFLDADGHLSGDTQTAYLLALDFDILDAPASARAATRLVELIEAAGGHLQTGFLGVRHLLPVLTTIGRDDLAVAMLLKDTYPSWGFSIRHGATTIWERWDGWTPDNGFQSTNMNSFNHYAYGSVGEWIWSRLAGIDTTSTAPGYEAIRLAPLFDERIGMVRARYQSHRGSVASHWQFIEGTVHWTIDVPANCIAHVALPAGWRRRHDHADGWTLGSGEQSYDLERI